MKDLVVTGKMRPPLDPAFVPAVLWNRAFADAVRKAGASRTIAIAIEQKPGVVSVRKAELLPPGHELEPLNLRYAERLLKFLLWQKGGWKIRIAGDRELSALLARLYASTGERRFDDYMVGERIHGRALSFEPCDLRDLPPPSGESVRLGRHFEGCRVGFDLGGSDRKCAAVMDGKLVYSDEVRWDPYFQKDPQYHLDGIEDSIRRAAAKLPRVDAIGGSAAGVYVDNRVRFGSLFRGLSEALFRSRIRDMFLDFRKRWGVPFAVMNDGEVTALAGSISMKENAVLGISMGTSLAGGYIMPDGGMTNWLNEMAFAPVDYREGAPVDEWSGDAGCGVQYFSQQAVARLCVPAGIELPADLPAADKLLAVQDLMARGHPAAAAVYATIGVYFGYTIAHYADFYDIRNLLLLGRVLSGDGGGVIVDRAQRVLKAEFPELEERIRIRLPGEQEKRHGQAMVAASLPEIDKGGV